MTKTLGSDVGVTMANQSIYEESETQKHKLGERLVLGDRVFRYCKNGAVALAAGKMTQGAAPVANHKNIAWASGGAVNQKKVTLTLGATLATKNQYADGTLHVNDATGEGQTYRIKSHPAADSAATLEVTLKDDIIVALVSGSEATLTKNKYDSLVIAPSGGLTSVVVGVPLVAVTAAYYFWACTKGPCAVLTQGTVVIGQNAGLGGTADGAAGPVTPAATDTWGRVMQVNASTEYSLIDLMLE